MGLKGSRVAGSTVREAESIGKSVPALKNRAFERPKTTPGEARDHQKLSLRATRPFLRAPRAAKLVPRKAKNSPRRPKSLKVEPLGGPTRPVGGPRGDPGGPGEPERAPLGPQRCQLGPKKSQIGPQKGSFALCARSGFARQHGAMKSVSTEGRFSVQCFASERVTRSIPFVTFADAFLWWRHTA